MIAFRIASIRLEPSGRALVEIRVHHLEQAERREMAGLRHQPDLRTKSVRVPDELRCGSGVKPELILNRDLTGGTGFGPQVE